MKTLIKVTVATILFTFFLSTHASDLFYVGFNFGQSDQGLGSDDFIDFNDGSLSNQTINDTDSSFEIMLGYQHTDNISIEISYIDLGMISFDATSDGSGTLPPVYFPGTVGFTAETDGWSVNIKGQVPLSDKVKAYVKFGQFYWSSALTLSNNGSAFLQATEDGSDLHYGTGLSFDVGSNTFINVNYSKYTLDSLDVDINVFSIGLQLNI